MWIKGKWYLHCSVADDSGISKVIFTDNGVDKTLVSSNENLSVTTINSSYSGTQNSLGKVVAQTWIENEGTDYEKRNYGYELIIPIGNTTQNTYGTLTYGIQIEDKSDPIKRAGTRDAYVVSYDNQPPSIDVTEITGSDSITKNTNGHTIKMSNGTSMIKGLFAETSGDSGNQSGFNRIAMYFTRTKDGKTYLVDPLQAPGTGGEQNWFEINSEPTTEKLGLIDGMYWIKATDGAISGTQLTVSLSALQYKFARTGSLVMINGVSYLISAVTPKPGTAGFAELEYDGAKDITITLDTNFGAETVNVSDLYFGAALIIDNQKIEGAGVNDITDTYDYSRSSNTQRYTNDDGDQMIEGVTTNGASQIWTANIKSSNIYDGQVKLYLTAYDAAGNSTVVWYGANVKNNEPRFAGLSYGTDDDGNGSVSSSEIKSYYTGYRNGNTTESGDIPKNSIEVDDVNRIKLKGKMKIIPEIVGGNKGLGYSYTYTNESNNSQTTEIISLSNDHSNEVRATYDEDGNLTSCDTIIEIDILEFLQRKIKEGEQRL